MKLRRIWPVNSPSPVYQTFTGSGWQDFNDFVPFASGNNLKLENASSANLLPFQPLSFRDFMLYERHAIDSTRGYVKRFMPVAYQAARLYERMTGATFPSFKPKTIWYRQPVYYFGNHLTFVADGTPVKTPDYSSALDYELELGFVLAKPLLNPTPEEALQAIGAFVVLCDFSARDVQRAEMESGFGPQKSKHFLSSMSSIAVTAEEILPDLVNNLAARVEINGKIIVETSTIGMQHSLAQVLCHAANNEQLYPGELFGTGTLPGGSGLENGHWLEKGCQLRLSIEGIGDIQHSIV